MVHQSIKIPTQLKELSGERCEVPATKIVKVAGLVSRLPGIKNKDVIKYRIQSISSTKKSRFRATLKQLLTAATQLDIAEIEQFLDTHL